MPSLGAGRRVREAWLRSVTDLGGDRGVAVLTADDLVTRYGETHRRYHSITHVASVIRDAAQLGGELGLDRVQRAQLTLAAAAHDVVYDARPGVDEPASAAWAGAALTDAGLGEADVERVRQLVLLTLTHKSEPTDLVAVALLDADLAILGSAPEVYAVYVAAVREEYASVPDELWRAGRSAVLADLAGRDRLYVSAPAQRRWDATARRNLRTELASLSS